MNITANPNPIPPEVGEAMLVGACFNNAKYLITLEKLVSLEWFQDPVHAAIFDNLVYFISTDNKLPSKESMQTALRIEYTGVEGELAIKKLDAAIESVSNVDGDYMERIIKDYVIQRGNFMYFKEAASCLKDPAKMHQLGIKMQELSHLTFDTDIGLDYWNDLDGHLDEIAKDFRRIATGFSTTFDADLGGGLYADARCLAIFMAQVHMGKSLFLGNIAMRQVLNGEFVVLISLEMDEHIYAKRFDAQFSKMDIRTLKQNMPRLRERLIECRGNSKGGILIIKAFGEGMVSAQDLDQYLDTLERKYKRKVTALHVDYLNLMVPNPHTVLRMDNSYGQVGAIARQVRYLSKKRSLPIISATQTNRGGFGNTAIDMQNTSESIDLPAIADVMWSIYRDDDDKHNGIIRTRYLKDRIGGHPGLENIFHFNTQTMEILEESEARSQECILDTAANTKGAILSALAKPSMEPTAIPNGDFEEEIRTENL